MSTPEASGRKRILRIGVLLGGKIVEERLIRDRTAVSVGQSARNTFSVPLANLPRELTLFAIGDDRYKLRFGAGMDGRISDGAQVYTFDEVKGNRAVPDGDHWTMPLTDQARGKIALGDLTLLFQFVTAPPVQPRTVLPASVRGTLAERIDPRLAVICAVSILVHFGVALAAWMHDRPEPRRQIQVAMSSIAIDTVDPLIESPLELLPDAVIPEDKVEDVVAEPGAAVKPKDARKTSGERPRKIASEPGDRGREPVDAAALQQEAARYAALLASAGESEDGVGGEMAGTDPGGTLDQMMKDVRDDNAKVEIGNSNKDVPRGKGDPIEGTGKNGPKVDPGKIEDGGGAKDKKEQDRSRIKFEKPKGFDESTLTPDAVRRKIQNTYMAGLKRCQKALLKDDPTARARVDLSFTVNAKGRTTGASAKSEFSDLSSCIKGQMASWTFPLPKDLDGEETDASFALTLALQPE